MIGSAGDQTLTGQDEERYHLLLSLKAGLPPRVHCPWESWPAIFSPLHFPSFLLLRELFLGPQPRSMHGTATDVVELSTPSLQAFAQSSVERCNVLQPANGR
jgi:hypothetical protein